MKEVSIFIHYENLVLFTEWLNDNKVNYVYFGYGWYTFSLREDLAVIFSLTFGLIENWFMT